MKPLLSLAVLVASSFACATPATRESMATPHERNETLAASSPFESAFTEAGVRGTFLLYDLRTKALAVHDDARSRTGFLPASTFKIFNSLVALDAKVVRDEHETIAWDGVDRGSNGWNRDHDLASALKTSAVWFYQEIARRVGAERMQQFLDRVGYGNRDMSGGIDRFWLEGGLRITPREQLDFLQRLVRNELPFSRETMDTVKEMLVVERGADYVVRAKTGWASRTTPAIGWYVGYVERGEDIHCFVMNLDIVEERDADARRTLTRRILADRGLVPHDPPASSRVEPNPSPIGAPNALATGLAPHETRRR